MSESTPMTDAQARITASAKELGDAMASAMRLAMRVSIAKQVREEYGPGPWILHEDGSITGVQDD